MIVCAHFLILTTADNKLIERQVSLKYMICITVLVTDGWAMSFLNVEVSVFANSPRLKLSLISHIKTQLKLRFRFCALCIIIKNNYLQIQS